MKNFKISIAWLAMLALVFTSCSKEEAGVVSDDPETVQLTFGALLNSFNQQNRQSEAECRDGVDPAYVILGGTTSEDAEPGTYELFEVGLVNNNGSWETTYSEDLELPAGTYYLQHFAVYDSNDQVLWVAPREGGAFADEVGDALPLQVNLVAGTKPYIDVDVLCYYAREEAAYGYPFFDFDVIEVENSYCVFVNYCDDETGRDYPAYFTIDVYSDATMTQEVSISNDTNTITMAGEWPSASVLCFALPDLGDDTYYARVTVLNHDDLDYTADDSDYYDFVITQESIEALETQVPAYHHIRFECDDDPNGGGEDEVCDIDAACELETTGTLDEFCYFTILENADDDNWVRINNAQDLEDLNLLVDFPLDGLIEVVDVNVVMDDGELSITLDTPYSVQDRITGYAIEVRPSVEGGAMNQTCWESECANVVGEDQTEAITESFDGFDYSYPFYMRVDAIFCSVPLEN
ncbi:hypothetical protein JRG66_01295 [Salinimicrobium tongyeongense]|jgi:hypothetical protein|uniref:Uncharacterized protein n=1 Tax=Salinimicrobium tongyeongense TaxID=2809707 RepID=A0ABY6NRL6_9FLAO|nr:hypothetical protein [Salinimicrobium tongyeongense]UZH55560.1 hypothetical protein JRG66_01295 [Salinimicrobium tongyeongense]